MKPPRAIPKGLRRGISLRQVAPNAVTAMALCFGLIVAIGVLTFLGAAGTVTGSKQLLDVGHVQILIDCGLFQGFKPLRVRNWAPLPLARGELDAVVLTHAHIDHSGYLPILAREGFRGAVYCTPSTAALCRLLLPDSAHLQELDASRANRKGYSRHRPALLVGSLRQTFQVLVGRFPFVLHQSEAVARELRIRIGIGFERRVHLDRQAGSRRAVQELAADRDRKSVV